MNAIRKTRICGATTAILLTVALAGTVAAKQEVPFHGSLQGVEIDVPQGGPPPTSLSVNGSATGIATHVGRFTVTYEVTVDLSNGSGVGSLQLIAANGDKIFTTLLGQGTPTGNPEISLIVEVNTITGGTGRFANATGTFTVERLVDLISGFTSGSFNGTISSPGRSH
jgi:hypothetical protein